ncbi:MAG: DUF938 domain-containing protein [Hyphomonadaceae bacterium]|nr:DUF938 domain-containing protein [Hyphomonadaceae bacterium]
MDARQQSPSAARNREPILAVLRRVLPARGRVLELASGSGEHAIAFASAMPGLVWRPSDPDPVARASIAAWRGDAGVENLLAPLEIDVSAAAWGVEHDAPFDALVCINMVHISPWEATLGLVAGAARVLAADGVLVTYGAYKREGRHTAPSNEAFDQWLKSRDPRFGVRDVDDVRAAASVRGLALNEIVEMPANNLMLIFVRA